MTTDACPAALELRDVVKHFDGVPALRGASLKVPRGTVHGLIGQVDADQDSRRHPHG
jgi:ribose transport system ATP-binding protein